MIIWERRNLAYFDRRQRLLAEQRQRQQQPQQGEDMNRDSTEVEEPQVGVPPELSAAASSSVPRDQQQPQQRFSRQTTGFMCAADHPQWRETTSRNIMGDYDPHSHRARREPAYLHAWMASQRLVNMNRSGVDRDDFIPTNPQLAAFRQGEAVDHQGMGMDIDAEGDTAAAATSPDKMLSAQTATEEKRSSQVQREAQGSTTGKRSSSGNSLERHVTTAYYVALSYPTQQLKAVLCASCNCALYTAPVAMRFFCQACGRLSFVPSGNDEER